MPFGPHAIDGGFGAKQAGSWRQAEFLPPDLDAGSIIDIEIDKPRRGFR